MADTKKERTPEEVKAAEKRDAVLRESYKNATTQLRANHLAEFNKLRQEFAKQGGVDWEIPLTDEQKAEQALAALLHEHPELVDKVTTLVPKVAAQSG